MKNKIGLISLVFIASLVIVGLLSGGCGSSGGGSSSPSPFKLALEKLVFQHALTAATASSSANMSALDLSDV